jgi:hypothetical protein
MNQATQESFCRSCGEPLVFLRTKAGKWMPVDAGSVSPGDELFEPRSGHESHWDTCPEAAMWRHDAKGG